MTTTAHEDQFTIGTQTIEPVRQPYNTVSILRRNIADMEVALRTQTERAEVAEVELEAVREDNHSMMLEIHNLRIELEQKPVAWMDAEGDVYKDEPAENWCPPHVPLYAAPVHAPAVPDKIMALSKKYTIDTKAYHAAMDALLQSTEATK